MLNTTERGIAMEVCEETNGDIRGKKVGGLLSGFRFPFGGLMFGRWAFVQWAFVPLPGQAYPKEEWTHLLSPQEPEIFFSLGHCFTEVFRSVHD